MNKFVIPKLPKAAGIKGPKSLKSGGLKVKAAKATKPSKKSVIKTALAKAIK
jgi:hypothetical protein